MISPSLALLVASLGASPATVVFMTDFGVKDDSVAVCKGVMLQVAPSLRIIDLTHEVEPYSVLDGARFLAGAAPAFDAGAVFVGVVDPGVGSSRKAIVARTPKGQRFVVPDNGLITLVEQREGLEEVREITNPAWTSQRLSTTFHGRDVFAPVAARLAAGGAFGEVGPPLTEWVKLSIPAQELSKAGIRGVVLAIEQPYGNIVTNLDGEKVLAQGHTFGELLTVTIAGKPRRFPLVKTFSDVKQGQPLAYVHSRGSLALAVNQGSFARRFKVQPLAPLLVAPPRRAEPSR